MNSIQAALKQELDQQSFWKGLSLFDWVWGLIVLIGTGYAHSRYAELMDGYEKVILLSTGVSLVALGWYWVDLGDLGVSWGILGGSWGISGGSWRILG